MTSVLTPYRGLSRLPTGRTLFSIGFARKAPYFRSIRPRFREVRPHYAELVEWSGTPPV